MIRTKHHIVWLKASLMGYLTLRQDQDQLIQKVGHSNSHQVTANFSPSKPTEVSSNQYSEGKTPNFTKLSLLPVHVLRSCVSLNITRIVCMAPSIGSGPHCAWQGVYHWLFFACLLAGLQCIPLCLILQWYPFHLLPLNSGKPNIGKYSTNNCFNTQGSPQTITSCLTNLIAPTLTLI